MIRFLHTVILIATLGITGNCFSQASPDEKFDKLGIVLPIPGNSNQYVNVVRTGNLIFLSGKGPLKPDGSYVTGKPGLDITVAEGSNAARLCAIHQLAILKRELGSLSKIKRIVKVTGFVNSTGDFTKQPEVMDGFSFLLTEIFGEAGKHTRSAVGVSSLPFGWAVEAEMIVEVAE